MSVDIHDMFMTEVRKKMDERGLFAPEEGWKDYPWYSKNYKAAEKALYEVCDEDGVYDTFKEFVDSFSTAVALRAARRIEENKTNGFDPCI